MDPIDVDAANKHLDFVLGWYMDPFVNGDYPSSMKAMVKGLPHFTKEQQKLLQISCDYIGINYYTSRYSNQSCSVEARQGTVTVQYTESTVDLSGNPIGLQAVGQDGIYVHPAELRNKYNIPEMIVTENGVPAKPTISGSVEDLLKQGNTTELETAFFDDYRIDHAETHLTAIREAMKEGVNVTGYFVWTLMDNMEVGAGYDIRFGLTYVDYYNNCKGYPKKSAKRFANFLGEAPSDVKLKGRQN